MNQQEMEFTDWLKEAKEATEFFYCALMDIENAMQQFYPGVEIRLTVRDVLLKSPRPKFHNHIYRTSFNQEFIITQTGATDTDPEYTNSKLYINFKSTKNPKQ